MKQGQKTQYKILNHSNKLFYHIGYRKTTFSDIVKSTGMSQGNITYHFKSKDDILIGVLNYRLEEIKKTFNDWDKTYHTPELRLNQFIDFLIDDKKELIKYGCPHGTMATELGKSNTSAKILNQKIFNFIINWFSKQFETLHYSKEQSDMLALEFFSRGQGSCILGNIYNDEKLFEKLVNGIRELIKQRS